MPMTPTGHSSLPVSSRYSWKTATPSPATASGNASRFNTARWRCPVRTPMPKTATMPMTKVRW